MDYLQDDQMRLWEVEKILEHRRRKVDGVTRNEYLISWAGFGAESDSWASRLLPSPRWFTDHSVPCTPPKRTLAFERGKLRANCASTCSGEEWHAFMFILTTRVLLFTLPHPVSLWSETRSRSNYAEQGSRRSGRSWSQRERASSLTSIARRSTSTEHTCMY